MWWMISMALAAPHTFPAAPQRAPAGCSPVRVEIAMTGDVMQHGMQLKASTQADGSYSWQGVFTPIEPLIQGADLAIANLETPVAGMTVDEFGHTGFSGYPFFNAPESLLHALKGAGFDVLQTANNHCLDRGEDGLRATLDALDRHGFEHTGVFRSAEDRESAWVMHTLPGGLTVGMVAYTYSTNNVPMPVGHPWAVNWLDLGQMERDAIRLREAGADLVVVGLHWGREYQHQPEPWQRELAKRLVDAGADIVMGTHPHVLQPAEVVSDTHPRDASPRDGLVLYSLGNFVSNQRTPYRDGGMIARVQVDYCPEQDRAWVSGVRFTPVWVDDRVDDGRRAFRVLPVPPPDQPCEGLDLSVADCTAAVAFRTHASTLFPAEQFSWSTAAPRPWGPPRVDPLAGVLSTVGVPPPVWLGPREAPAIESVWPLRPWASQVDAPVSGAPGIVP